MGEPLKGRVCLTRRGQACHKFCHCRQPSFSLIAMPVPLTDLPIELFTKQIASALSQHKQLVLSAPPGSGKTTLVPIRLWESQTDPDSKIIMAEPRRIAARAACRRMASLTATEPGDLVGYVTRDRKLRGPQTRIEVVTEGVLTRRIQQDPHLAGVGTVIFDEVHERNLHTDLGWTLVQDLRKTLRPDLHVLVMSATVEQGRFQLAGEEPLPLIKVPTEQHPVEVSWIPLGAKRKDLAAHTARVIREALEQQEGGILVFLPGMAEIQRTSEQLTEQGCLAEVRILHGSLPVEEQDLALRPATPPFQKVVLSTDLAESSLTVEGINTVIDSGLARVPRYDPRTGMTRLRTVSISKASATQRAGRAGRTGPGVVYRLWSKAEHAGRGSHHQPEILQVELAGLALELAQWNTPNKHRPHPDPEQMVWWDQPPTRVMAEANQLLTRLEAIEAEGKITSLGRKMLKLPLHPRLAHMVVKAGSDQLLACFLAAVIEERDFLTEPWDRRPVDINVRLRRLLRQGRSREKVGRQRFTRVHQTAADIASRMGVREGTINLDRSGRVLALAYPDRLAGKRGSPGRFQLLGGTTAWLPEKDGLAAEQFVVIADLDGKRKDTRIRLAAPIDTEDVMELFSDQIHTQTELVWKQNRLWERATKRLGGILLQQTETSPLPGEAVTAEVAHRLRDRGLADLDWTTEDHRLRDRVRYLRERIGEPWPDWEMATLARTPESWLFPAVPFVTGLDSFTGLSLGAVLKGSLPVELIPLLDRLAPARITLSNGFVTAVDYTQAKPSISARAQSLYGITKHPQVGEEPITFEVLSPARRPLQVTSDLPGFWAGSWREVRKEMLGRYPKHSWPENPGTAHPVRAKKK